MVWAKLLSQAAAEPLYRSLFERLEDNEQDPPSSAVFALTSRHHVSAYDATYITLAELFGVRCVTEDRELLSKFPRRAVSLDEILQTP